MKHFSNIFILPQTSKKPEYGTDSYNRPGKNKLIGPSRGMPGSILQKRGEQMRSSIMKKQEQSMMKRHCNNSHVLVRNENSNHLIFSIRT